MFFSIENFVNDYTLNIFTDASIRRLNKKRSAGCHGAIILLGNQKLDDDYRICTDSTSNNSEIKGIRLGVGLALKWRTVYPVSNINLFSDSQISIFGIRDRIFNWKLVGNDLVGYGDNKIKNQSVFIEILNMIVRNQLCINFYHQKGHINPEKYNDINIAIHVFSASNFVREDIDPEFIKFISYYNDIVDRTSRDYLYAEDNIRDLNICDVLQFLPFNFKNTLEKYNQLQGGNFYV